jgi:hypothetical protein
MPTRGTRTSTLVLTALVTVLLLAVPSSASAARGAGAATITSCGPDRLTVTGRVAVSRRSVRKVRRATLEVRFAAMPLFGLPRIEAWRALGRKTRASAEHQFSGLGADSWGGVMSWRFKRGSRTVMSGIARSEPRRIGRSRGRANCIVSEGLKPVDTTPPTLYILPLDTVWHRAPTAVQLLAQDDFSGVQSLRYSLDGGPITELRNGATFTIPTEGAHTVQWAATDVAGNTGTRSEVVRVDAAPPSKPALSSPFAVTASTTPTFSWTASTDTGSGLKGYFIAIKRADGSLLALRPYDANTTSVASPVTLTAGETYTATVIATDNTSEAWTVESDPLTFRVDPDADAAVSPAGGTVLTGGLKDTSFTITLDRNADPNTVSSTTVVLDRHPESGADAAYTVSCSAPCNTITVDPTGTLPEGRYVLSLNGVKSEEGVQFANPAARYSVPFVENGGEFSASTGAILCSATGNSDNFNIDSTDPNETGFLDFSYEATGSGGTLQAYYNGNPIGQAIGLTAGSGTARLTYPLGQTGGDLSFRASVSACNSSVSVTPLVGARNP